MVAVLKRNEVLQELLSVDSQVVQQVIDDEIKPRLHINKNRPDFHALRKISDDTRRKKLVGRALLKYGSNPTLQCMLLLQNVDAVFGGSPPKERKRSVSSSTK